jgi:hypothetical protein
LVAGIASPVIIDSSMYDDPETTTPSTGTRSPGRTTISSPTTTWSSGTSDSRPARFTRAVAGASFNSASTALPVAKRLRISIQ